jgi:hypothetical protein
MNQLLKVAAIDIAAATLVPPNPIFFLFIRIKDGRYFFFATFFSLGTSLHLYTMYALLPIPLIPSTV